MIKGLGFGANGCELNDEPMEASRARYNTVRSEVSTGEICTAEGLRGEAILEINLGIWEFGILGVNWLKWIRGFADFLMRYTGSRLKWGIEAQNLRISIDPKGGLMERYTIGFGIRVVDNKG